ncbi:MAG: (2Fe-2S) ferredoxin domain-containing protein [Deltaproteobacteria bacterium]
MSTMRPAAMKPATHLFVCANARDPGDALRSACGEHGPRVYRALKRAVTAAGLTQSVWLTRTLCLGHCPASGCAVAIEPAHVHLIDVTESEVAALLQRAQELTRTP